MWRRVFGATRQDVTKTEGKSDQPYTTLPPISYQWIFRGSSSSGIVDDNEDMPPLVKLGTSTVGGLTFMEDKSGEIKLKCVLVGDGAVGKTSLVVSYTTNGYPTEYVPTAFDNYTVVVNVDNKPVRLQLCDTAGQDDFDSLRPLCYPGSDVFMVCFSVVSPTSFQNVKDKWLPELRLQNPSVPVILVGTQSDLRTDVKVLIELAQYQEQPVSEQAATKFAEQIGAVCYVESSALTQKNLKEVFDQAIVSAMAPRTPTQRPVDQRDSPKRRFVSYLLNKESGLESPAHSSPKPGWKKLCCFVS